MRFEDLTELEALVVVNGCGAKYAVRVPDFGAFHPACAQHDLLYWCGGDAQARREADRAFLADMLAAASREGFWRRLWLRPAAWVYWAAVRAAGGAAFHWGAPRTRIDLAMEVARLSA